MTRSLLASVGIAILSTIVVQAAAMPFLNQTVCPRIVSREEWKARKPLGRDQLPYTPTPYVVIHHGGIPKYCDDLESCSAIVRSYQNFHIDDRKWFDVGYNFLIGGDGNAYVGRGWDAVGAHAPDYNSQSIGICMLGDFSDFLPTDAALEALDKLIACGVAKGKISENYKLIGHRQARDTLCPGEKFYEYVMRMDRWTSEPTPVSTITTTTNKTIKVAEHNANVITQC